MKVMLTTVRETGVIEKYTQDIEKINKKAVKESKRAEFQRKRLRQGSDYDSNLEEVISEDEEKSDGWSDGDTPAENESDEDEYEEDDEVPSMPESPGLSQRNRTLSIVEDSPGLPPRQMTQITVENADMNLRPADLFQTSDAFMSIGSKTSGSRRKKAAPFNPVRYLALVLSEKVREK